MCLDSDANTHVNRFDNKSPRRYKAVLTTLWAIVDDKKKIQLAMPKGITLSPSLTCGGCVPE